MIDATLYGMKTKHIKTENIAYAVKRASKYTGTIMIESHLTYKNHVHRKPIFKKNGVYVRYFKQEYKVNGCYDLAEILYKPNYKWLCVTFTIEY